VRLDILAAEKNHYFVAASSAVVPARSVDY